MLTSHCLPLRLACTFCKMAVLREVSMFGLRRTSTTSSTMLLDKRLRIVVAPVLPIPQFCRSKALTQTSSPSAATAATAPWSPIGLLLRLSLRRPSKESSSRGLSRRPSLQASPWRRRHCSRSSDPSAPTAISSSWQLHKLNTLKVLLLRSASQMTATHNVWSRVLATLYRAKKKE